MSRILCYNCGTPRDSKEECPGCGDPPTIEVTKEVTKKTVKTVIKNLPVPLDLKTDLMEQDKKEKNVQLRLLF